MSQRPVDPRPVLTCARVRSDGTGRCSARLWPLNP